jgi:hypothetical protein
MSLSGKEKNNNKNSLTRLSQDKNEIRQFFFRPYFDWFPYRSLMLIYHNHDLEVPRKAISVLSKGHKD